MKVKPIAASYKDPSGFVFSQAGSIYRQINLSYRPDFDHLISSGLYQFLTDSGWLVRHADTNTKKFPLTLPAYKIIQAETIPFISYPYEWCFSMLQDAALLTLAIQKKSLEFGMTLKDASAYNIQFFEGKPIFIDTLSFQIYREGEPWVAYKQFIEHFLAPLALMVYRDVRLNTLLISYLDGLPVDLATRLLPLRAKMNPSLFLHLVAHSASQRNNTQTKLNQKQLHQSFSRGALLGLIDNLEHAVKQLKWTPQGTEWLDYYQKNNNYRSASLLAKEKLVKRFAKLANLKIIWDLGANTGHFSRLLASPQTLVLSFDIDYGALETNYRQVRDQKEKSVLPLFCDLTNPSPALGWANQERLSLFDRGPADLVLALALVHHLAIAKNIPLAYIASLFAQIAPYSIVEFVPKEDSQVKKLLMNRPDIFPQYTQDGFENTFTQYFSIVKKSAISGSKRTLYLMKRL